MTAMNRDGRNDRRELVKQAKLPNEPGVYIVWAGSEGGVPLYVGVAATQTIADRWRRQHLYPRAGGSALRRTLGVHLGLVSQKLRRPERYYPREVEVDITSYLEHCWIECRPTSNAAEARVLENEVIESLKPVLNVRGRPRGVRGPWAGDAKDTGEADISARQHRDVRRPLETPFEVGDYRR